MDHAGAGFIWNKYGSCLVIGERENKKVKFGFIVNSKSTIEKVLNVRHHRSLLMETKNARHVIMDGRSMIHKTFRIKRGSHGS